MAVMVQMIAFNHRALGLEAGLSGAAQALNLRRNALLPVAVPEWQRGVSFVAADSPAAYALDETIGRPVVILVRFARLWPQVVALQVRAVQPALPGAQALLQASVNVLGEVAPQTVVFLPSGESAFVAFTLRNTRLASCGVGVHTVRWRWQYRFADAEPWIDFAATEHTVYTVLRMPRSPWAQQPAHPANTQLPWADALDYACRWAQGTRTPDEAATAITNAIYTLGQGLLSYECTIGATAYALDYFLLSEFIELLRGGVGRGRYVNCSDCAAMVATFANLLGADLWQSRMGSLFTAPFGYFPVNPVRTIGSAFWGAPCGWWPGWSFHEVAWSRDCGADDTVFDGCLQLDAYPPYRVPLQPANLRFGRIGEWAYRDLLAAPTGRQLCEPVPFERRRRPVA